MIAYAILIIAILTYIFQFRKISLLLFVLMAVAALGAQAASLDWSLGPKSITSQTASPAYAFTKTVYLLDTTASDYADLAAALSGGTLAGGIAGFDASKWSAVIGSAETYSNAKTSKQSKSYGSLTSKATVGSVATKDYVALVFDQDAGGKDYYVLSSAVSGLSYTDNPDDGSAAVFTSDKFGAWTEYVASSSGGGVPEPTSGLLLVLGGAMLALRRRRA